MKRIYILKKKYLVGDFDNIREAKVKEKLKAMRSKSISIVMRGWKAYSDTRNLEEKLMERLRDIWRDEKQVMRTLIFCHLMEIYSAFSDGVHSETILLG